MGVLILEILIILTQIFMIFVLLKINTNIQSTVHEMTKVISQQNQEVIDSLEEDKKPRRMLVEVLKSMGQNS
jgi:hypothetical protein